MTARLVRGKIKYVFVIYQENRSFDSYFGTFPGAEGIYSHEYQATSPGFTEPLLNVDGTQTTVQPFRIGPAEFAADTDDVDHSHPRIVAKMDVQSGVPNMDRFALVEEQKRFAKTPLEAKQYGELAMAHLDCDTIPFLWNYAKRFTLYDRIFQTFTGPSTPGNLAIIGAQSGETQFSLHPNEGYTDNGSGLVQGVPVLNDRDPAWGPANNVAAEQLNLTYATLPLTLAGENLAKAVTTDTAPATDLGDIKEDVADITATGGKAHDWGWFEEGYDHESTDQGPLTAEGTHASYVTHHNGPQYFGYIANNTRFRAHLHGLGDFFSAIDRHALPHTGGVYYLKGGFKNLMGLTPADPNPAVQKNSLGDDDHPGYSDAQISEALVADEIDHIVKSPYWNQSAIVLTWDDSEGNYDHVVPPLREVGPGVGNVPADYITDGPRVPLMVISPFSRQHTIVHSQGDQGSVVKLVDAVFGLKPLAELPDELKGRANAAKNFGMMNFGPDDALTPDVSDLLDAFDPARLGGSKAPISAADAYIPEADFAPSFQNNGTGCKLLGITPTDRQLGIPNPVPSDFNPRPATNPSI